MLDEFELYLLPDLDDSRQLLVHLEFIFGLIRDIFNGILILEELQVPNGGELQVLIHLEILLNDGLHVLPMPFDLNHLSVSLDLGDLLHGLVLQFGQKGKESSPLLDVLLDSEVSVHLLVDSLDSEQGISQFLDLII